MNYRSILLILMLVTCGIFTARAQNTRGKVIDAKTGEPLVGVNIAVGDASNGTVTGEDGAFDIDASEAITFSYTGYVSQTVQPTNRFIVIQLVQASRRLSDVVVTAFNAKRELSTVSAPVAVIGKQDLNRADNSSIIPALNSVPGVKLDYYTLGDYRLNIRGGALAQPSVHSSGFRMYWNGIPISSGILGGLDINFIDNIEVIKGPGSSLYGAGFGGTVLLTTQKASQFGTSVSTDFMLGRYNTMRSTTGIRHNWKGGNLAVQYSKTETDGYRDMTASDSDVLNVFGQIYTGEKGAFNLFYNYADRSFGIAGDLDEATFNTNPTSATTIDPTNVASSRNTVGLGYTYDLNSNWSFNAGGFYNDSKVDFLLTFPFFGIYDDESSDSFTFRSTATYRDNLGDAKLRIDGGFELGNADSRVVNFDADYTTQPATAFNANEAGTDQLLVFSQAELIFPSELYLNLGFSYNRFSYDVGSNVDGNNPQTFSTSVDHVAPRISLLKKINEHSVFASVGQGFTPPGGGIFNDFLNTDGSVNQNLKPSRGWNFELGARGNFAKGHLFYDVTGYSLNVQDAIISQLFEVSPGVNAERKVNAGEVKQTGLEALLGLNATVDPDNFWHGTQLRLGYTFNDFEYEDYQTFITEFDNNFNPIFVPVNYSGNEVPGTIPNSWLILADVRTRAGVYANFSLNTYDETFLSNDNNAEVPSYSLVNLKVGYEVQLADNKLTLSPYIGMNNVGDTLYSGLTAYNSTFGAFFNPAFRRQAYGGIGLKYNF